MVTIHPFPDSPPETIRHLLLNQVLPLVLSRRGRTVLHASAVSYAGRVAAFIGVGVFGALAVAAVKIGAPFGYLLILLALAAPLAGLLHWLESWLAHDIAYRLLAEMRIDIGLSDGQAARIAANTSSG